MDRPLNMDKKIAFGTEAEVPFDEKLSQTSSSFPPNEWYERLKSEYSGQHGGETLPAGCDLDRMASAVLVFDVEESLQSLRKLLEDHHDDYSIDQAMLARVRELLQGNEACSMEKGDWEYEVCKRAGLCLWSPYVEVRSVVTPYDDVDENCETLRAYILGYFWVCVCTAVNTFFNPRQPGISIPNPVVQVLLVPMGRGMAWLLPDWGFRYKGVRYTLNPGPWTSKEQLFATIMFSGATTIGNFTGLLVLRLPAFFDQRWAKFGFNILLALANQGFGLGMAGILRRLSVYPVQAVWPGQLPTLALNRALVTPDNAKEKVNGWRISRLSLFGLSALGFGVWYWVPNKFFEALRLFNWMTWISPNDFNLATVTGAWGGMGFNPISTFDPNVSGHDVMNSPFFAQLQQYVVRALAGVVILIMYYTNAMWAAFMPINSNGAFDNHGGQYNITKVLNAENRIDVDKYQTYGPPYYAISNLFVTGGNFVYYAFSLVYVFVTYWRPIKKAFLGIIINTWKRQSVFTGFDDGQTRMVRKYKEVPEWWYGIILALGFAISVAAVAAFPTQTPWWTILAVAGIGGLLTIPWVVVGSIANTGISTNVIWQVLPGVWFPGQPLPQLILLMLGGAFEQIAGGFTEDLKYAHYARIAPRAIFRGHVSSVVVNCLIYCAMLEVLLVYAGENASLCQWDNPQHMVCAYAHSVWSSTILFGAFGTNNMFKLYPVLPYCFLIGAFLGLAWVVGEKLLPRMKRTIQRRMDSAAFANFEHRFWDPISSVLATLNPAIALSGGLQWSGNNNLAYATFGIFLAFVFQFYLKRRYTAWWSKYAYLSFAGMALGIAISGLIVTLVFSFGAGKDANFNWWGNKVGEQGVDYQLYNNNASLYALPDVGYFGLSPDQYPLHW